MQEPWEILGREPDFVDDIRHNMESFYSGAPGHTDPSDGDWHSDDYIRVIDIATQPNITKDDVRKIDRSIQRLNANHELIAKRLGRVLSTVYRDVASQINTITETEPCLVGVEAMASIEPDAPIGKLYERS